jgi:hypothetical protein
MQFQSCYFVVLLLLVVVLVVLVVVRIYVGQNKAF